MLYVSTRDQTNTYTAHRALFEQQASDCGMFAPFSLPKFTVEEISDLCARTFCENIARILNLFFSAKLTGWDVDFCCGRYPVNIVSLPHKLILAEAWHNTTGSYAQLERVLYNRLCGADAPESISNWAKIAIRISLLFATYALYVGDGEMIKLDVAVDDGDFVAPLAAWYARRMGLPIDTIICGCFESSSVWDLLHRGELNTVACKQNPGLEHIVYAALGQEETVRFVSVCQNRKVYHLNDDALSELNDRIFAAVTSAERIGNVISAFKRSNNYTLDRASAISFGARQDFRAKLGENKPTLIFSLTKNTLN